MKNTKRKKTTVNETKSKLVALVNSIPMQLVLRRLTL